jgi:hypothetical protein
MLVSLVSFSIETRAGDSCWNWYGEIQCSLKTEGGPVRNKLVYPEGSTEKMCRAYPYLAEHKWKECKPYLKDILDQQK